MRNMKEIAEMQDIMFQTMEAMYQAKQMNNYERYKLCLSTLNELNKSYAEIAGKPFVVESKMMMYYEYLWEMRDWNS